MTSIAHDLFPHRLNRDGSFDSICKRCFQTIASGMSETALAAAEQGHTCDGPPLLHSLATVRPDQFVSVHN
jgi:phage tail protein X